MLIFSLELDALSLSYNNSFRSLFWLSSNASDSIRIPTFFSFFRHFVQGLRDCNCFSRYPDYVYYTPSNYECICYYILPIIGVNNAIKQSSGNWSLDICLMYFLVLLTSWKIGFMLPTISVIPICRTMSFGFYLYSYNKFLGKKYLSKMLLKEDSVSLACCRLAM